MAVGRVPAAARRWQLRELAAELMRGALGLAVGLALVACGVDDGKGRVAFSQVEVQAYLEREAARTLPGLAVGAATCPPTMPERIGATVTCTVVLEGVPLDYQVQRLVADRFEARPARPIVVVSDVVAAVQAKLGAKAAQVRCGGVAVAQPASGQPLLCQVSSRGSSRTAMVRVGADGTLVVTDA